MIALLFPANTKPIFPEFVDLDSYNWPSVFAIAISHLKKKFFMAIKGMAIKARLFS